MRFFCRLVGHDDVGEWHDVKASSINDAVERYAAFCDAQSGGDLFGDLEDVHEIQIKLSDDGEIIDFLVELVEFEKVFYAREIKPRKEKAA